MTGMGAFINDVMQVRVGRVNDLVMLALKV